MNVIKCGIPGCSNVYQTVENVSSSVKYVCRDHDRQTQVDVYRPYNPLTDNTDNLVKFQDYQFDPDLARGGSPKVDSGDDIPESMEEKELLFEQEIRNFMESDIE